MQRERVSRLIELGCCCVPLGRRLSPFISQPQLAESRAATSFQLAALNWPHFCICILLANDRLSSVAPFCGRTSRARHRRRVGRLVSCSFCSLDPPGERQVHLSTRFANRASGGGSGDPKVEPASTYLPSFTRRFIPVAAAAGNLGRHLGGGDAQLVAPLFVRRRRFRTLSVSDCLIWLLPADEQREQGEQSKGRRKNCFFFLQHSNYLIVGGVSACSLFRPVGRIGQSKM